MSGWVPELIAQRWVKAVLSADATVQAQVGVTNIYPNLSPGYLPVARHLTHTFGGSSDGFVAKAMRSPISRVGMFWDVTGWEPSYQQLNLESVMEATMEALIGTDTRGGEHRFVVNSRAFLVECDFIAPQVAPVEAFPAGTWAPIRHRYALAVRPA
jgi:hypothetical protein